MKPSYKAKEYSAEDAVRIVNPAQIAAYWENGLAPLDIYPSRDRETGKPILVAVFNRKDSKEYFDKWCKHELS